MTTLAYLDAGAGSMMLQAVLGGAAGLAVMGRLMWSRFKRGLFFWRKDEEDASPRSAAETDTDGVPPRS